MVNEKILLFVVAFMFCFYVQAVTCIYAYDIHIESKLERERGGGGEGHAQGLVWKSGQSWYICFMCHMYFTLLQV